MKLLLIKITCLLGTYCSLAQSGAQLADQYYEKALNEYRQKLLEEADSHITKSLNLKGTAKSYYLSGMIYEAMEKDLRAVAAFEAAVKLDPQYYEAIFQKGLIYLNYGDPEQAVKDFNVLISLGEIPQTRSVYFVSDPSGEKGTQLSSMANLSSQFYNYRAQALAKLERYDEALEDYNEAIARDTLADYYIGRGLLHHKMSRGQMAIDDLKRAIALDPGSQLAWYNMALLDPSIDLPDDLLADSSFGPTLGLLASRAMEEGRLEEARRYFDQSILNDKNDALSYINRGRVLIKLEAYSEARKDFNKARRLEPTRFECLYLTANTYFFEKDFERAVAFYNEYLSVDPTNAMIWYNGAMCLLERDEMPDACHYLNKAQALGMVQAHEMIDKHCR